MRKIVLASLLMLVYVQASAQKYPERRLVRSGNKEFAKGKFTEAEIAYRRALDKAPGSYESADNLGKALYKMQRYEEAASIFAPLATDSLHRNVAPEAWYDFGNAMFQQRKLEQALEAYKKSLRLNPGDMQAKFNLAYVQKLLNKNQGGGGPDDKDKQQQPENKPQPQQGQDKPQPDKAEQKEGMSRQDADQMLQAVQMNEDKTREKVDKNKEAKQGAASKKNW